MNINMVNKSIETTACISGTKAGSIAAKACDPSDKPETWRGFERPAAGVSPQCAGLFHLIAENVSDYAIFAQDSHGFIVSWNRGVGQVLGYGEKEFLGRHVSLIFTPEDIEDGEVEEQMRVAAAAGRAKDRQWHVRRDGSRFWANGLLMPLRDVNGKLTGFARIIRDDTEQKKFEDERDAILAREREARQQAELLRESLERSEHEKDEFLALLAHELRNPLNAILGWLLILRKGKGNQQLITKALETIEACARSQDRMIEDVFDVSRIRSGKLRLNAEPMSLNETVGQAVESIRPVAQAKNISLETAAFGKNVTILGDPDRIKQVIINILSNAVKFTPKKGRIQVSLKCSGSTARIVIKDNGVGFGADFLPHIFDRYAQANKGSVHRHSGLGLGLPLVRELVERHGGKVTAESAGEGLGATFKVSLPIIEAN